MILFNINHIKNLKGAFIKAFRSILGKTYKVSKIKYEILKKRTFGFIKGIISNNFLDLYNDTKRDIKEFLYAFVKLL